MNKTALTLLMLVSLIMNSPAAQELIANGDLEIGVGRDDKSPSFEAKWWRRQLVNPTNWSAWLTDDTYQSEIGPYNHAFLYSWGGSYTYQDFSARSDRMYSFSCDNYNGGDSRNRWQAIMEVEWYDDSDSKIGNTILLAEENNLTSPSDTWNPLSATATSPANTAYGRFMLGVNANDNADGSYWQKTYIDNVSVTGVAGTDNLPCSFISSPYSLRLETISESDPYNDTLTNYADDRDGDTLTFTAISKPDWLTIASNGTMSGTPSFADAGEAELVVTVEDGHGHSDTQTLNILVNGFLDLDNLYDNDMVLQRNQPIPVTGIAIANTQVTVTMSTGESTNTTADANGDWSLILPAMPATTHGAVTMTVTSGSRQILVTNVLVGDVWICSGQSNMDFRLSSDVNKDAEIASASYPNLRHVNTPATKGTSPWDDLDARAVWQECTPDVAGDFSAVAYYFGKSIMLDQNIPIGLINSSKGGSSIDSWSPTLSTPGSEALYNSKIHPYTNMPIRGIVWYQAEANVGDGSAYTGKMETLAADWRVVWGTSASELPFYFVQLAPYNNKGDAVYELPETWAAQTDAMRLIPNSGMAIINDIGNIDNIHPTNKAPVGERLALWAKYGTYGQISLVHSGPVEREVNREGSKLRVSFDHVGSGLVTRDGLPLDWFEIAGDDQIYVAATATVDGDDILVSAASVTEPEWVRFAWHEIAEPNLMNVEGLPAGAFSTRRVTPEPFKGELLQNRDFETGSPTLTGEVTFNASSWSRYVYNENYKSWLTNGTYDPVIGARNQAIEIKWASTYIYQNFPAIGEESYLFSVDVLNPTDANNRWEPQLQVEWLDSSDTPIGSEVLLDQGDNSSDPYDTWFELSGSAVAPSSATSGRIRFILSNTGGDGDSYFFDNASVIGALDGITFANWVTENGSGPLLGDDDLDFATNLEEYAYNLDPAVSDAQTLESGIGAQGLPLISFANSKLQVEYLRRKEAVNLVYEVQVSTNLTDWCY